MVIDHHHVGRQSLFTRFHDKAFFVIGAIAAQAIVARGGDARPNHGVFWHAVEFAFIAAFAVFRKGLDDMQILRIVTRGKAALLGGTR